MLRLLQNKLSNKSLFFREIIIFVTFLHFFLIVLFCLLGFKRYHNEKFVINSQSKLGSVIVFMPLKKHVDPAMNTGNKTSTLKKHQSRKVIDYQSYLKKQGYNVVSGAALKPDVKKPATKKTVLKKQTKPKAAPKPKPKPVVKKTVAKKVVPKSASVKASADKKVPAKKIVEPKNKPVPKKKPAPKPVEKKEAVKKDPPQKEVKKAKPVDARSSKKESKKEAKQVEAKVEPAVEKAVAVEAQSLDSQVDGIDLSDVTFVGYRDLDKLQLQSKIQQAVEMYWSAPVGMPKKTKCELQVTIEKTGRVAKAKVVTSSKVMAFDLAARSAIHKTKFPRDVWGKQIMVELGI